MVVSRLGQYLVGRHFIVRKNHKAFKYLLEKQFHTGSLLKWITKPLQFDFEIEYRRGKENKVVDALSRNPAIELATLTLSTIRTNLLQSIMYRWEGDTTIQMIIHQLQNLTGEQKGYNFDNQQLRRKRKLVVGPMLN